MWNFLLAFIPRAIVQGIPLLYGSTGEIVTEKSGNLNLGIPGVMYVGAICGVIGSFFYEHSIPEGASKMCIRDSLFYKKFINNAHDIWYNFF